jgi:hypothetical protein
MENNLINYENKAKENLWNKELWNQQEVADYFRVTSNTIKNWRERGLLSFFQAPGSTRIQYFRDEICRFRKANSVLRVAFKAKPKNKLHKEKPVKSDILHNEDWRI